MCLDTIRKNVYESTETVPAFKFFRFSERDEKNSYTIGNLRYPCPLDFDTWITNTTVKPVTAFPETAYSDKLGRTYKSGFHAFDKRPAIPRYEYLGGAVIPVPVSLLQVTCMGTDMYPYVPANDYNEGKEDHICLVAQQLFVKYDDVERAVKYAVPGMVSFKLAFENMTLENNSPVSCKK